MPAQTTIPDITSTRGKHGRPPVVTPVNRFAREITGTFAATSATASQSPAAVLVTPRYGTSISQWETGTTELAHGAAVLRSILRDVIVTGSGVSGDPGDDDGLPDQYAGVLMNGSGYLIENLSCWNIPGAAGSFNRPNNARDGQTTANDRTEPCCRRLQANRVFRGFVFAFTDGTADDIVVHECRDEGVTFSGNSIDFSKIHVYGCDAAGILVSGNKNRGQGVVGENAVYGLHVDGDYNIVSGVRCFDCDDAEVYITGAHNVVRDLQVEADSLAGVYITDQFNTVQGGFVDGVTNSVCVTLTNGVGQRVVDLNLLLSGTTGAKGLVSSASISYCTIDVVVDGGSVGADISAGVGAGCDIKIRTRSTTTPAVLPATWPASSTITVNGVLQVSG